MKILSELMGQQQQNSLNFTGFNEISPKNEIRKMNKKFCGNLFLPTREKSNQNYNELAIFLPEFTTLQLNLCKLS